MLKQSVIALATIVAVQQAAAAPLYRVEVLPNPTVPAPWTGLDGAPTAGVNASHQVVVNANYMSGGSPGTTGALLYQNGRYSTLPIPPGLGDSSLAAAINNEGAIVGSVWDCSLVGSAWNSTTPYLQQAVVWNQGTVTILAAGPYGTGGGTCINDQGQVGGAIAWAGTWDGVSTYDHAAWWDQNGVLHDLGSFGGQQAQVCGINNQGQMLISVLSLSGQSEALLWDHGITTPLGPLTVGTAGPNNQGHMLGSGFDSQGNSECYFWNGSSAVVVPSLTEGYWPFVVGLNDEDQAILDWAKFDGNGKYQSQTVLWDNGTSYDLNDLLEPNSDVVIVGATSLASDGSILAQGWVQGQWGYFLLTPAGDGSVPEPASLALLALGAALLTRRRP